ncbi:MAG: hypothetical protein MJ132_03720 [Clostridia bacterium]|nr:hypothetical protein [Clostridia bacterium]
MALVNFRKKLLEPVKGSEWADTMVLNPAIIKDKNTGKIHMLFRATGPYAKARLAEKPLPYPIFLGYAYSTDGQNFRFNTENPALAPALKYTEEEMYIMGNKGEKVVNYANGCIEDPRLFYIGDQVYLTVACRMFPPGPYWEHDDPAQCMPAWGIRDENPFNTQDNPTVTVLYSVDLKALENEDFENAFTYITNLTNPKYGQDRDVILLDRKIKVKDKMCYVMLHRPVTPNKYPDITETRPSVFISAAENFEDFQCDNVVDRRLLLAPSEDWQSNRIGVSTQSVRLNDSDYLICYHGKKDDESGYGQSFFVLTLKENELPFISKICQEKLIAQEADFEMPHLFKIPCVFFTGMIEHNGNLLIPYGAADEFVGLMEINYEELKKILAI